MRNFIARHLSFLSRSVAATHIAHSHWRECNNNNNYYDIMEEEMDEGACPD